MINCNGNGTESSIDGSLVHPLLLQSEIRHRQRDVSSIYYLPNVVSSTLGTWIPNYPYHAVKINRCHVYAFVVLSFFHHTFDYFDVNIYDAFRFCFIIYRVKKNRMFSIMKKLNLYFYFLSLIILTYFFNFLLFRKFLLFWIILIFFF